MADHKNINTGGGEWRKKVKALLIGTLKKMKKCGFSSSSLFGDVWHCNTVALHRRLSTCSSMPRPMLFRTLSGSLTACGVSTQWQWEKEFNDAPPQLLTFLFSFKLMISASDLICNFAKKFTKLDMVSQSQVWTELWHSDFSHLLHIFYKCQIHWWIPKSLLLVSWLPFRAHFSGRM